MLNKDPETAKALRDLARANPTRLDMFAAAALTGLLARMSEEAYCEHDTRNHNWDCLTDRAVLIAAEMLWSIEHNA